MITDRIFNAIVLNDYIGAHYATQVELGIKTIETRMRKFKYTGDIVICCGGNSVTGNKAKALCLVHLGEGRPMTDGDIHAACIGNAPGRIAYHMTNRRLFSRKFTFSKRKVSGTFQGIFQISIPEDIQIYPA
jgi:hypothetical protein